MLSANIPLTSILDTLVARALKVSFVTYPDKSTSV
jgi:hypothetical protein